MTILPPEISEESAVVMVESAYTLASANEDEMLTTPPKAVETGCDLI